ncbi:MAG TPA: hypothetical protein VFI65_34315 [Streptosporangiaceae bacterium]|nr:hypothetical protein [Streptosporangiaceae bacterium]
MRAGQALTVRAGQAPTVRVEPARVEPAPRVEWRDRVGWAWTTGSARLAWTDAGERTGAD